MSMIRVENLTFSYPSSYENIFENVSFQLDTDWKLGFIGRNGRGKTTFLRLLLGELEYAGRITAQVPFSYFPYSVAERARPGWEVLREICPAVQDWELERELMQLGVAAQAMERPFQTLSNGEQTKVLLAALFLNEGRFLLIDEPTNHLDRAARESVAAYLARKQGFILVSHDRAFLDGCVDHILSLNRASIDVQAGNFSSWYENFNRLQSWERTQDERLQRQIGDLRRAASKTAAWSARTEASKYGNDPVDRGYIGHKSAKLMKRAKTLQARQKRAIEEKSQLLRNAEKAEELKLAPLSYHAQKLVEFRQVAPCYDGKTVCAPVSFSIERGERVLLEGGNGSGKSSLLKLLSPDAPAHTGTLVVGPGLRISRVPQDTGGLYGSLKELAARSGIDFSRFLTILRKMDFSRAQFEKPLQSYSEGQKKKVLLARSLCESAHLYIWDEPLNYIDLYSRLQLEQLLREYAPTMLFVEHDGAFAAAVATRTIRLQPRDLTGAQIVP